MCRVLGLGSHSMLEQLPAQIAALPANFNRVDEFRSMAGLRCRLRVAALRARLAGVARRRSSAALTPGENASMNTSSAIAATECTATTYRV
jgi:hypothetical protein